MIKSNRVSTWRRGKQRTHRTRTYIHRASRHRHRSSDVTVGCVSAVAVSTGDRMVLSHFSPANRAITRRHPRPDPPHSFLPRAAPTAAELPLTATSGWRVERIAAVTSGWSNEVVMETRGRVSTLGHTPDSMADNLPFSSPACPRQGRRPSRSRISQRPPKMGGWESSRHGGKPHRSPLYIVKGPSTLRVPLILPHTMHLGCVSVCERAHARRNFSILVILFVIDAACMCGAHTADIGLNPAMYSRTYAKQMQSQKA